MLHANDLLPVAFTPAALDIMVRNVEQVQGASAPILVENLSAYVGYDDADDHLPEAEFLAALARRSGCGLLLDVNNLMVNALNARREARRSAGLVHRLRRCAAPGIVGEIHLAGYCDETDFGIVIDDHGSRVRDAVWQLYAHALRRFGADADARRMGHRAAGARGPARRGRDGGAVAGAVPMNDADANGERAEARRQQALLAALAAPRADPPHRRACAPTGPMPTRRRAGRWRACPTLAALLR